jgi:hypothetical protein
MLLEHPGIFIANAPQQHHPLLTQSRRLSYLDRGVEHQSITTALLPKQPLTIRNSLHEPQY